MQEVRDGRLTVNAYSPYRTRNQQLIGWLAATCED